MSVPTNLIPTKITGLPEYTGSSQAGYFPYVLDGSTYKVQFSNVASAGEVPPSRTLTAGTGLVGGGDLSANRVFAIANGGVGASQLDTTGVVAGVYGNGSNVPTVTVDANGRVTSVTTSPVVAVGYVPEGRTVTAGTGLLGGGSLAGNITLSLNLATATPQALGIATAGVSIAAARGDHVHPAVDLSDTNETQGSLPLGRGGTGDALSPVAGAVVYSTGSKFALTNPGIAGQVLTSGGTDEPSWTTITGVGTVTSVDASGGTTGMTFTGGPITTAGTLTLGGTLLPDSGGTGLTATPTNGQLLIGDGLGYTLAALTAGTAVSITNAAGSITIDNTAPDQIVSLTGAGTTSISGTYPNFTITSNDEFGGTVTSVAASGGTTGLTFSGSPITTAGTLTLGGTLAVANGGTGATTASGARTNLGAAASGANSDITSLSGITGGISTADFVAFDTANVTMPTLGQLAWNNDDGTLDVGLNGGAVLQLGQETLFYAKNTSGGTVPLGAPVMFTGVVGASGKLTFGLAVANGTVPPEYMMGVATQNVANNAFGYVTSFGLVRGFNTSGSPYGQTWVDGDLLYFDPATPGGWTNVQPVAPNIHVPVAVVINAAPGGSGSIFVRMIQSERLGELQDVYINGTGTPIAGQVLIYDAAQQRWENNTLTAGSNVTITNGNGAITIAATDQFSGTVTSVAASGGATGLTFTGSPITTSGTLTLGGTLAVASGGTGASNAGAARTALGAAALGANTDITSIALTSGTILNAPTSGTDIVNKAYADSIASGINFHQAVRLATVAALPAYTYNNGTGGVGATITANANGALSIDGVAVVAGNRVLIKDEVGAAQANHGVYVVTQTGNGSTPFILTRATDFDSAGTGVDQIDAGDFFLVTAGATLDNTSWVQQTPLPITVGTTPIIFSQFGAPVLYSAGTGLSLAGTVFSITNTGVSASTYGSASSVPVIAVNAQGQISSASSTSIAIAASQITSGALAVARGGTALTATPTNGQLLIGNGTGYSLSTLTAGTGVSVTNGSGSVTVTNTAPDQIVSLTGAGATVVSGTYPNFTITSTAGTGTVTSVDVSGGSTGLSFTGGPITSSGIITMGGTLAVANGGTGATSLSSGFLLRGNGTSPVSASVVFDNGTNVGIGTTAPRSILSAASATGSTLTLESTDTTLTTNDVVGEIDFYANDASTNGTGVKANIRAYAAFATGNGINLAFGTSDGTGLASDRMVIGFNGNVGIGTSSPSVILDVQGSTVSTSRINVLRTGGAGVGVQILSTGAIGGIAATNSGPFAVFTSDLERMRITSAGNVGIGTTAPLAQLNVPDSILVTNNGGYYGGQAYFASGSWRNAVTGQGGYAIRNTSGVFTVYTGASTSAAGTAFTDFAERMRIASDGTTTLSVGGVSSTHSFLYNESGAEIQLIDSTGAGPILLDNSGGLARFYKVGTGSMSIGTTGVGAFLFQTNNVERMRITSAGLVGIGTTSPGQILDVRPSANNIVQFETATHSTLTGLAAAVSFSRGNDGATDLGAVFGWNNGGLAMAAREGLAFATGGAINYSATIERMRITSAGFVGIGTSSPATILHVDAASSTETARFETDGNSPFISIYGSAGRHGYIQANDSTSGFIVYNQLNRPMRFFNNAVERMRITETGNVGIGTSSPGQRLTIQGAGLILPAAGWSSGQTAFLYLGDTNNGVSATNGGFSTYFNFNGHNWNVNGTEAMRIDGSRNVGIGTTTPGARLDVIGNARIGGGGGTFQGILLTNSDNSASAETVSFIDARNNLGTADGDMFFGHQTDGGSYIRWDTTAPGARNTDRRAERMRITPTGNVGIGTSSPGGKLDVSGVFRVQTNGDVLGASSNSGAIMLCGGGAFNAGGAVKLYGSSNGDQITFHTGSFTERMRIGSNGGVAIGGTGTDATLHIQTSYGGYDRLTQIAPSVSNKPALNIMASKNSGGGDQWWTWGVGTDNTWRINQGVGFNSSTGFVLDASGNFTTAGNVTAFSDARIKKDVATIDGALDLVSKMRGVRYTRIDNGTKGVGVIAQEMLEVLPEVIQQGLGDDDTLSVAYGNIVGVLIEAVKELTARVVELESSTSKITFKGN